MEIGETAPDFTLPDTDGEDQSLSADGAQATAVVFTCNHCPYALAWHDRILDVARDYSAKGVRVLAVNPNDAERYPGDSYDAMLSDRPYTTARTPGQALAELRRCKGTQFDPDVVDVFCKIMAQQPGVPETVAAPALS